MSERKVPAKLDFSKVIFPVVGSISLLLFLQTYVTFVALSGILSGDLITAVVFGILSLFFLWSTGSLYIALPLVLYFHTQYRRSDPNYTVLEMVHKRALRLLEKLPFRRHLNVAVSMSNLGLIRLCQGAYESAVDMFSQAATYIEKCPGKRGRDITLLVIYNNLAVSYIRQNKCVEAELIATKAMEIAEKPEMQKKFKMVEAAPLAVLAASRLRLGEYEGAIDYARKALDLYEKSPIPPLFSKNTFLQARIFCLFGLALSSIKIGKRNDSFEYFDQAMALARENPSHINTLAIEPFNMLANEYANDKSFDRAEQLLEMAYAVGRDNPYHPDAKQTLNYFEKVLLLTDRENEIADMRIWLRHLDKKYLSQSS